MQTACWAHTSRGGGCLLEHCLLSQPLILLSECKALLLTPRRRPEYQFVSHFHSSSTTLSSCCRTAFGSFFSPSLHLQNKGKEEWRWLVYEGTGHKGDCCSTTQSPEKLTDPFHLSCRSKASPPRFSVLHETSPMAKQQVSIASPTWYQQCHKTGFYSYGGLWNWQDSFQAVQWSLDYVVSNLWGILLDIYIRLGIVFTLAIRYKGTLLDYIAHFDYTLIIDYYLPLPYCNFSSSLMWSPITFCLVKQYLAFPKFNTCWTQRSSEKGNKNDQRH